MTSIIDTIPMAITGMGLVTPVGYDASTSCASIRAGICRLEELGEFPYQEFFKYDKGIPEVVGARVRGLTDGHLGLGRFSRLAITAFGEALGCVANIQESGQLKVVVGLPDKERPGRDERLEGLLPGRISKAMGIAGAYLDFIYVYEQHASGFKALALASDMLKKKEASCVVVGGVDSLVEPATLLWLNEQRKIKNDENPDGFNPGEAAFFLVVEQKDTALKKGSDIKAYIEGVATAKEEDTIISGRPASGVGLGKVLGATLLSQSKPEDINMVICDLNGTRYRSVEWGNSMVRALSGVKGSLDLWHHADCIGDTGCASAGVSIINGISALIKDYAKGETVLVWGSGDSGMRGSLLVKKPF